MDIGVLSIEPTPNPNALKFIINAPVLVEGRATFRNMTEANHVPLCMLLFSIHGVREIHFFENVITITKDEDLEWEYLEGALQTTLDENLDIHNPDFDITPFKAPSPDKQDSPELEKIDGIIDQQIRAALQADGGDMECIAYENNILTIRYEGACGSCPSSQSGTLQAIKGILRAEFDPYIEVVVLE